MPLILGLRMGFNREACLACVERRAISHAENLNGSRLPKQERSNTDDRMGRHRNAARFHAGGQEHLCVSDLFAQQRLIMRQEKKVRVAHLVERRRRSED